MMVRDSEDGKRKYIYHTSPSFLDNLLHEINQIIGNQFVIIQKIVL